MIASIYVLLLTVAVLGTAIVITWGARGEVGGVTADTRTGIIASGALLVIWGLLAINAFEITTVSGGEEIVHSYPQLAWVAVAGGAIALYSLLQATIEEINATGGI